MLYQSSESEKAKKLVCVMLVVFLAVSFSFSLVFLSLIVLNCTWQCFDIVTGIHAAYSGLLRSNINETE